MKWYAQFEQSVDTSKGMLLLLALALLGAGCLSTPNAMAPCDEWNSGDALCPFMNPEDLAHLSMNEWVLVSEMTHSARVAEEGGAPAPFVAGRLRAIRVSPSGGEVERRVLFPQEWNEAPPNGATWGDTSCSGPPTDRDFEPHGIDVGPGPGGTTAVAVVNHGKREVIDLFEFRFVNGSPGVLWRGCVPMPAGRMANDVALVEDGFFVTDMIPTVSGFGWSAIGLGLKMTFGGNTGSVLRWTEGGALVPVPGSKGTAPNGIAATRDGGTIWVAEWGGRRVYRIRMGEDGRTKAKIEGSPDNLNWAADGKLLVAAQDLSALGALGCGAVKAGGCDIPYTVTKLDPESMVAEKILEGRGAASAALEVGDEIWVGVFVGDAIERRTRTE